MAVTKTEILVTGAAAGSTSATVTIELAGMATVCLKGATNTARAVIELQDDAGIWQPTSLELTAARPETVLMAPGDYRLKRVQGAFGAFKVV